MIRFIRLQDLNKTYLYKGNTWMQGKEKRETHSITPHQPHRRETLILEFLRLGRGATAFASSTGSIRAVDSTCSVDYAVSIVSVGHGGSVAPAGPAAHNVVLAPSVYILGPSVHVIYAIVIPQVCSYIHRKFSVENFDSPFVLREEFDLLWDHETIARSSISIAETDTSLDCFAHVESSNYSCYIAEIVRVCKVNFDSIGLFRFVTEPKCDRRCFEAISFVFVLVK